MLRLIVFLLATGIVSAQAVPGRYIVQFSTEPAAKIAAAKHARYSASDVDVIARRSQIRAEHAAIESQIQAAGGAVVARYDTVFNGLAVQIADARAALLWSMPGVQAVFPDSARRPALDHAVNVHRVPQTWNALTGGQASAGANIRIAILDTGIDAAHPGFQGFSTAAPSGFPIVSSAAELANTNAKVIVSRDYTGTGGNDTDGHGTGVAMIAAGLTNTATYDYYLPDGMTLVPVYIDIITGVAPGAWLGNYKVCDPQSGCLSSWFLQALDDAVNDGMNVVNYSGSAPDTQLNQEGAGAETLAITNALGAGVPVVMAAGDDGFTANRGQAPGTIGAPAVAPDGIAVGSIGNERTFGYSVKAADLPPIAALIPDSSNPADAVNLAVPITAQFVDVAATDGTGLACSALPPGSVGGQIVLIQRGNCSFDTKLSNAAAAGAFAAVVYDDQPDELITMSITTALLPAMFVGLADGQNLKALIAESPGVTASLDFSGLTPFPVSASLIANYSPVGPTPAGNIKPDLMAVGGSDSDGSDEVVTADSTNHGPNPYRISSGTSLAAPFVTGSLAVLMAARPGLIGPQYKSLVVNSAPALTICANGSIPYFDVCSDGTAPVAASIQSNGAGRLDLFSAFENELVVQPTAVNFKTAAGGSVNLTIPVSVTDVGGVSDSFTVTVNPIDGTLVPSVDTTSFSLDNAQAQVINVTLSGSGLAPGTFSDGYIVISEGSSAAVTRIPYWFGVPGTSVSSVSVLNRNALAGGAAANSQLAILIRSTDQLGLPLDAGAPKVTSTAAITNIAPSGNVPGTYEIDVKLDSGGASGYDAFVITAGGVTTEVDIPVLK
ncbi:MAG TPA: S8 family serine peptidase [Bryobacteraceae bacterium]|nr:S8 family serine peptidase [Bryobacteraceae bacterium]